MVGQVAVTLTAPLQKTILMANGWSRTEYHPDGKDGYGPYEYWRKDGTYVCVLWRNNEHALLGDNTKEVIDARLIYEFVFLFDATSP